MTCASIDSRPTRSSRPSSRSTSLRASVGQLERCRASRAARFSSSALVVLAQLLLDRLELLAQEHLALPLAQLLLDLRLDVLLRLEHADLALHVDQHAAEPLLDQSVSSRTCLSAAVRSM